MKTKISILQTFVAVLINILLLFLFAIGLQSKALANISTIGNDTIKPIFIKCLSGSTQIVNANPGKNGYTHIGTIWDAEAIDNVGVVSTVYELSKTALGSGTSLDGVEFPVGLSVVTWRATDGSGNVSTCVFTVIVMPDKINHTPVALPDTFLFAKNKMLNENVLLNDSDADNDSLSVINFEIEGIAYLPGVEAKTREGIFTIDPDGKLILDPVKDFDGEIDSIKYTVADTKGAVDFADVFIQNKRVISHNIPLAIEDIFTIDEGESLAGNVLENDNYNKTDSITTILTSTTPNGKLTLNNDGSFDYRANYDFTGSDSFVYEIYNANNEYSQNQVNIEVKQNKIREVTVPNGFSPNGDGINDCLKIGGIYNFPNAELRIFTRSGIEVFRKANYGNNQFWGSDTESEWWGESNISNLIGGDKLSVGTYIYILELNSDHTKQNKFIKGTIFINY